MAKLSSSPWVRTRSTPGLSVVSSGAWCGKMPISPSSPGATTMSTSPSNTGRSWLTISTRMGISALRETLGLGHRVVDRAHVPEGLFRQVVVLAVQNLAERAHRLAQRHVDALQTGELLGRDERLAEELFHLARASHQHFVVFRQLVHAQDGDDVLQVLVALQHPLHLARRVVVVHAHD